MPREYSQAGVDYTKIEPFKQAMQATGKRTLNFPNRRGSILTKRQVTSLSIAARTNHYGT